MEKNKMQNIYCVKCRKFVKIENPKIITLKSERPAFTGECPHCKITVYKIFAANSID